MYAILNREESWPIFGKSGLHVKEKHPDTLGFVVYYVSKILGLLAVFFFSVVLTFHVSVFALSPFKFI